MTDNSTRLRSNYDDQKYDDILAGEKDLEDAQISSRHKAKQKKKLTEGDRVKVEMLSHHLVGIHDQRMKLGSWTPHGYAIFKRAPGEYYFVSWHSGIDPGITSDNQVRKWMKDNILHHG